MLLRQLFDLQSSTYTYLLADPDSRQAALIDPVEGQLARDVQLLRELGLQLSYALETHVHADHITASGQLRDKLGCVTVGSVKGARCTDIQLSGGEELALGALRIGALPTPGHTDDSLSYHIPGHVFTGDALLIRGTGRTDFQHGDAGTLYDSLTQVLFRLPDNTVVWPGHDYHGQTCSTIGEEKQHNPRLGQHDRAAFIALMDNLNLPPPKLITEAVPRNRACGRTEPPPPMAAGEMQAPLLVRAAYQHADPKGDYRDIGPQMAHSLRNELRIIDVREAEEYSGELGHIANAELVPLGQLGDQAQHWNRDEPLLLVCRSGRRSANAAKQLRAQGFQWLLNLEGGMLAHAEANLPTQRQPAAAAPEAATDINDDGGQHTPSDRS